MGFETPLDDIDIDGIDGFDRVKPGRYHAQVQQVSFDDKGQMIVDYELLHGTVQTEIGKSFRDYFSNSATPGARKRALLFALATKIVDPDTLEELKRQRRAFNDYEAAVGKHLKIELGEDTYEGKTRTKCGFEIYAIDSPKAEDIPVNKGVLSSDVSDDDPFNDAGDPAEGSPVDDEDPFA